MALVTPAFATNSIGRSSVEVDAQLTDVLRTMPRNARMPVQWIYKLDETPTALANFGKDALGKLVISLD